MASSNQLRARLPNRHIESIEDLAEKREINETDAERVVVREGLTRLGYLEDPKDGGGEPGEMLLEGARMTGVLLALVGFALVGYSVFVPGVTGYVGFGLVLAGFAPIAGAEFAPWVQNRIRTGKTTETGELA